MEVWNRYANQFRRVLTFTNRVNHDLRRIVDMHEPLLDALRRSDREALRDFYQNHGTDLSNYLPVKVNWQDDGAWESSGDGREDEAMRYQEVGAREPAPVR